MGSQHDLCSILTSMTMYHHKSSTSTVMHQYRYNARKSRDVTLLSCRSNHHGGPSPFLSRRFWVVPDVDQAPRPSTGTVRVAHAAIQASKQHRERHVPYRTGQDIQESIRVLYRGSTKLVLLRADMDHLIQKKVPLVQN